MKKLQDIKIIVWDIDGTLYQTISSLKKAIYDDALKMVKRKLAVNKKKAAAILEKNYQKLASTSRILLKLGFNWNDVFQRLERCYGLKAPFIKKDLRLALMFGRLSNFRHLVASNNPEIISRRLLVKLGLDLKLFERVFGNSPDFIKPELKFFQRILDYTNLPAGQHLFIGDREETEIIPAKKLGMKTCFVWGQSKAADISLPTVYEIPKALET